MTNDFAGIASNEIGQLTQIQLGEVYAEKTLDDMEISDKVTLMTKEQYKAMQRQQRLDRTNNFGEHLGKLMRGEVVVKYDNSAIWNLRNQIAIEIAPEIRRRQLAWANMVQNQN